MFCDEKIKNVYLGQPKYHESDGYFLDCYCDMAVHLNNSYRLIFESDSFYIIAQTDGVSKILKNGDIQTLEKDGEWIESFYHEDDLDDSPWADFEYTLFTGEKIVETNPTQKGYLITFSDFILNFIIYSDNRDVFNFYSAEYGRVLGAERLIRKCQCGGTGILVLDFVSDYCIRCNKCHRGTSANPVAIDAIDEWNDVDSLPTIDDYPYEKFEKHLLGKIDYIAIWKFYDEHDRTIDCDEVIIRIDNLLFSLESCYSGQGIYGFSIGEFSDFNPEFYPKKIVSTDVEPILIVRDENKPNSNRTLYLSQGNKQLCIAANTRKISITTFD